MKLAKMNSSAFYTRVQPAHPHPTHPHPTNAMLVIKRYAMSERRRDRCGEWTQAMKKMEKRKRFSQQIKMEFKKSKKRKVE